MPKYTLMRRFALLQENEKLRIENPRIGMQFRWQVKFELKPFILNP
jgi:hypothetical protein